MVGRGWWLLVWTVYAAWTVYMVHGGLSCQQGQEFYNSEQGHCVPCTRCNGSLVVVVPCYVYRDAVCAPAAQFLPTWSRLTQPQAPITLSTPTAIQNQTEEDNGHGKQTSEFSSDKNKQSKNHRKVSGHQQGKSGANKAPFHKSIHNKKNHRKLHNENDSEKTRNVESRHHHRHRHSGERTGFRAQNKSLIVDRDESVMSGVYVSQKSGASESVNENRSISESVNVTRESSGNGKVSVEEDASHGANSDKDETRDSHEPHTADWQTTFFLAIVIVISICVIALTIIVFSHLRNVINRRKLKRECDTVPEENSGELTVMEHLLPSLPAASTNRPNVATNRAGVTYVRPSAMSVPLSFTTTASGVIVLDSEHTSGHVYPPIPFTMDRLLEQRRVLGPSSSVDTNLYIESWQQQDSQPAVQHPPSISTFTTGPRTFLRGSVSACPSPVPVRTYRLGPASASASPIFPIRGLGSTRGRMRGTLIAAACTLSGSSGGVVSDFASVTPT
ncbi:uncharacterized protein [Cherax quadricarinatus]|nr:uncharacterized protein LOC128702868 [Cherax quadricarinatus]